MNTDNTTCWFVMTHLEMKYFMEWLKTENAQRLRNGETVVEPFYPYDFLKETEKSISNDFAHIVFLKTTESDIRNLVNNQSHLVYRLRLKHYLDTNGAKAIVPDKTMQEFLHCLHQVSWLF